MNARERSEYRADGLSAERRAAFAAAQQAAHNWRRRNPLSLDEFIAFLESYQALFGPLPQGAPLTGSDFRL